VIKKGILLFFVAINCFSQKKFSKQISLTSDNDLFISLKQDRYYTSGVFLTYDFLSKKENEKLYKKVYTIQIGQQLYTPFKANVFSIDQHDRPFAGYLYGGFEFSNFRKDESIIRIGGKIGIIGPSAFGEELMNYVHEIYGFVPAIGWKYQIKEAFALNFNVEYTKQLSTSKYIDINSGIKQT